MWVLLAFVSAFFLGFYDVAKKKSLAGNSVLTVLFCNTLFCALIFLPAIIGSGTGHSVEIHSVKAHALVIIKAFIVLSSWIMGYYALKHLRRTCTVWRKIELYTMVRYCAIAPFTLSSKHIRQKGGDKLQEQQMDIDSLRCCGYGGCKRSL